MKNVMKKVHNRKGFTLIELIIVIIIIAILAAIAIPAVSKYVGEAKESQKVGNYAVVESAAGASAAKATVTGTVSMGAFKTEFETIIKNSTASSDNPSTVKIPKSDEEYQIRIETSGAISITTTSAIN